MSRHCVRGVIYAQALTAVWLCAWALLDTWGPGRILGYAKPTVLDNSITLFVVVSPILFPLIVLVMCVRRRDESTIRALAASILLAIAQWFAVFVASMG